MTALAPLFLWLLPLAALPVLFHLFFRVRTRRRPFPSFLFLRQADPRLHVRRRLREWLVLACRVLAIILLLLALARPVWQGRGGGGPVAMALVLDNSASMGRLDPAAGSALHRAVEGAMALLEAAGPRDDAALFPTVVDVLTLPDGGTGLAADALRSALRALEPTQAAGEPAEAVSRAADWLAAHPALRREIHVFSDLQPHEWTGGGRSAWPTGVELFVHRVRTPPDAGPNVSLGSLRLPAQRPVVGRAWTLLATVQNRSMSDARVRLNSAWEDRAPEAQTLDLQPQEIRLVPLRTRFERPGRHTARVWVEGDVFAGDNESYVLCDVAPHVEAWLSGAPAALGWVRAALAPEGDGRLSGVRVRDVTSLSADLDPSREPPALLVSTWDALAADSRPDRVRHAVERGMTLVLLPDPEQAASARPALPWLQIAPSADAPAQTSGGWEPFFVAPDAVHWDALRGADARPSLGGARVVRAWPLVLGATALSLLADPQGRSVAALDSIGSGVVVAWGIAWHPEWTTLPLKGHFVALAQSLALRAADGTLSAPMPAGRRPAAWGGGTVRLEALRGGPLQWNGPVSDMPPLVRAGVYGVESAGRTAAIAVAAHPEEGALHTLALDALPAWAAGGQAADLGDSAALAARVRRARRGLDLAPLLLTLAVLLALSEVWLANPPARPVQRAGQAPDAGRRAA